MIKAIFFIIGLFMINPLFSGLPIKAIIFDCDGTLVDSEGAHLSAWQQTLQNHGHVVTSEQCLQYVGKSDTEIAKISAENIGYLCSDELLAEKNIHYCKIQEQGLPSIEKTVDFLKRLANEKENLGFKLGIASAAIKSEILSNLRNLGIEELFDLILSGHDDLKNYTDPDGVNKPKPYIYQYAMKTLGIFPAQCVVIEDSFTGVSSSVSAGCFTIAIPNVYTRDHNLSDAHLLIESFVGISVDHFFQMIGKRNSEIYNRITNIIEGFARQSEIKQKRYIITGGPGCGKTSVINELAKKGYLIVREAATDIIEEELQQNIQVPWMADDYHIKISTLMAKRQAEVKNSKESVVFFDRGHLDGITYILLQRRKLPQEVVDYVQTTIDENFFDKTVFFIENLEFYEQAPHRDENLEEALEKSYHIKQNYQALGYEVINIPPGTIEQRSEWIINQIQQLAISTAVN
jgi:beta-phosphoglucomutase